LNPSLRVIRTRSIDQQFLVLSLTETDKVFILQEVSTSSRVFKLRSDGIIESFPRPDFHGPFNLETAKEAMNAIDRISGNKKRPIVSHLSELPVNKEVREYLSGQHRSAASALIVRSTSQRIIGNIFTGFSRVPFPIKLFTSEAKAIEWLKNFIE
jgi:hypothetical protein